MFIKDLGFKVKILEDALKLSEDKLNSDLHSKYFPSSASCHVRSSNTCHNSSRILAHCSCPTTCPTSSLSTSCCYFGSSSCLAPPPAPATCAAASAEPTVPLSSPPAPNLQPSPNSQVPAWQGEFVKISSEIDKLRVDILQMN